jgi:hypothetical protein
MKPAPQGRVILTRKLVGDFHPQNDSRISPNVGEACKQLSRALPEGQGV